MSCGGSAGGGQSSLGYLFGSGEAPAPKPAAAAAAPTPAPAAAAPPDEKSAAAKPDVAKQIPAGIASQTNNYHRADGQNTGNFLTNDVPETKSGPSPPQLDCIKCFDALWFCYSPVYQMQNYYRYGEFDNCFGKWGALVDCLTLKTKRKAEVEEILIAREKAKPHIWTYRSVDEAKMHWWQMYKYIAMMSAPKQGGKP